MPRIVYGHMGTLPNILLILFLFTPFIFYNFVDAHESHQHQGGPLRTKSENLGHMFCKPPKFKPKNPNMPQQVHLALTNKAGEMNITWITFHDDEHPNGVFTFVKYWEFSADAVRASMSKKILVAKRIRHEYTDTIDIKCSKEDKPKNWNKMNANIRFIHTITLTDLVDDRKYGYKVGYCVPAKIRGADGREGEDCVCLSPKEENACKLEYRTDRVFNFKMFPWNNSGDKPFTFVVFGDLGLKKPDGVHIRDEEKSSERSHNFDSLAPDSMQPLIELVHRRNNKEHPMLVKEDKRTKMLVEKEPHRILKTHLDKNSSGLVMDEVQLILHIGDIAYDLHEWHKRKTADGTVVYNLGDRFMHIVEDVAAYVPYMVVAGNHENEEKKAQRPDPPGAEAHYDPQYEHYESRFNMPRNFDGHDTNQYYSFTFGPILFVCVSTEYYYSFSTPSWQWIPDFKKVQEQYDFIEYTLIKANMNRDKRPWVVVVQHRPFYCTSKNKYTCRDNKSHKNGIEDPDNAKKLIYGLEELYNKYHVDLVITGHEHTYEMFPPIQLHRDKNRVVPYKYWWHAKRSQMHTVFDEAKKKEEARKNKLAPEKIALKEGAGKFRKEVKIEHEFMAYRDPVAPTYIIVGRPGNDEELEKLAIVAHLQRVKQYNRFSITLVHYAGKRAKKSFLAIRQVDVKDGFVPLEFALEKTFSTYDRETICHAIEDEENAERGGNGKGRGSMYKLEPSGIIQRHEAFTASEKFLRKKIPDPEEFSIHLLEKQPVLDVTAHITEVGGKIKDVRMTMERRIDVRKKVVHGKTPEKLAKKVKEINEENDRWREMMRKVKKEEMDEKEREEKLKELAGKIKLVEEHEHFTGEELAEIESQVTWGGKAAEEKRRLKDGRWVGSRELLSVEEMREAEWKLLMAEVDVHASENSKIRALLHAYNLRQSKRDDGHIQEMYTMAKKAVCRTANFRRIISVRKEADERKRITVKIVKQFRPKKLFGQFEGIAQEDVDKMATEHLDRAPNKGTNNNINVTIGKLSPHGRPLKDNYKSGRLANNYKTFNAIGQSDKVHGPPKKMVNGNVVKEKPNIRIIMGPTPPKQAVPKSGPYEIGGAIIWSRGELRSVANIIAYFYILAFLRGDCPKAKIFKDDGNDSITGLRRFHLLPDKLKELLGGENGVENEKGGGSCFVVDYEEWSERRGKHFEGGNLEGAKITTRSTFQDMTNILEKKREYYGTLLDHIFRERSIEVNGVVGIHGIHGQNHGRHAESKTVISPGTILDKLQQLSLEREYFNGRKAKWMVVDDKDLVDILAQQFLYVTKFGE